MSLRKIAETINIKLKVLEDELIAKDLIAKVGEKLVITRRGFNNGGSLKKYMGKEYVAWEIESIEYLFFSSNEAKRDYIDNKDVSSKHSFPFGDFGFTHTTKDSKHDDNKESNDFESPVLEYWKLVESTKIENSLDLNFLCKMSNYEEKKENLSTHKIKTVYHSLIKIKDLHRLICKKNDINYAEYLEYEKILKECNTQSFNKEGEEYTYLARSFFDESNNIITNEALNNIAIDINPIMFYLANNNMIKQSKFMQKFNSQYCPVSPKNLRFVPDTSALIGFCTKYSYTKKNIFEFLFPINSYVYISGSLLTELEGLKLSDNEIVSGASRRISKDIAEIVGAESKQLVNIIVEKNDYKKNEHGEILASSNDEKIVLYAIELAKKFRNDYIYLYTKDVNQKIYSLYKGIGEELCNFYAVTFASKKVALSGTEQPFSIAAILDIKNKLCESLKLDDDLKELFIDEVYLSDANVSNDRLSEITFNNPSFFYESLLKEPRNNALIYLKDRTSCTDIEKDKNLMMELNNISNFPNARWFNPFKMFHSQQIVVNKYFSEFGSNSITSVNGAPGTGKTTLIKDIVAQIIYKKALKISIDNFNMFDGKKLKPNYINSDEIFIVSNNNGAVENISKELPLIDLEAFEYIGKEPKDFILHDIADSFLKDSFAFISVALGNQENLASFSRFIARLKREKYMYSILKHANNQRESVHKSFRESLDAVNFHKKRIENDYKEKIENEKEILLCKNEYKEISKSIKSNIDTYKKSCLQLKECALEQEIAIKNKSTESIESNLQRINQEKAIFAKITEDLNIAIKKKEELTPKENGVNKILLNEQKNIEIELNSKKSEREDLLEDISRIREAIFNIQLDSNKKSFFKSIFRANKEKILENKEGEYKLEQSISKLKCIDNDIACILQAFQEKKREVISANEKEAALVKDFAQELIEVSDMIEILEENYWESKQRIDELEKKHNATISELDYKILQCKELMSKLVLEKDSSRINIKKLVYKKNILALRSKQNIESYLKSQKCSYPTQLHYSKKSVDIETSSFYDDEFNKERALLFYWSLRMLEINFILNSNQIMYRFMNEQNSFEIKSNESLSALSYMFPVVSTTLASFWKMTQNTQYIASIICDESGQAEVLSGYGFMCKTKNSLIVGDPFQIEPIITSNKLMNDFLIKKLGISKKYDTCNASIQTASDLSTNIGSVRNNIEIGIPLKIHRRCVEPIFSISNEISYENKIFNVTPDLKENDKLFNTKKSAWYHVETPKDSFSEHISHYEEAAVRSFIIQELKDIEAKDIFIISPFRIPRNLLNFNGVMKGTFHQFQGKEADVVFIILGGKNPKAREWVVSKPNMINVAITRARKRLYVIGNYKEWGHLNHIESIIRHLGEPKDISSYIETAMSKKMKIGIA